VQFFKETTICEITNFFARQINCPIRIVVSCQYDVLQEHFAPLPRAQHDTRGVQGQYLSSCSS